MSQNWKTVRVFISSTFRDMQAERDHLVRVVFPELKERCLGRHVRLIDIDLRWGVSEKQADGGGALDICLDTIDSCRPYFLALLGQRYGYIPHGHSHSITAQEIYHGVLHDNLPRQLTDIRPFVKGNLEGRQLDKEQVDCLTRCYQWNPEKNKYILKEGITPEETKTIRSIFYGYSIYQKDRSFFYFRSESLTRQLAGSKIDDYFEIDEDVKRRAHIATRHMSKTKLARLKQEIIDSELPHFEYDDIETFGHEVLETLWGRISAEFPEEREEIKRDWFEEEAEFHELFIADRTRWFVGRTAILRRMHSFVEEDADSRVMVIMGESGCGKSALMARFTEQASRSHPDWLILPHFVGASPSSTSLRHTLRRLVAELNRTLGVSEEVPEEYKELSQLFPQLLERTAKTHRILLIVDALNQFEKADNAHTMRWLPQELPLNVKVVVSTLAGEALDALRAWRIQPRFEKLGGLTEPETEQFVANYLKEFQKEFPTPEIRDTFYDKIKAGNPLYILVALEELRVFPVYEKMSKRVDSLPNSVPELFDQVLERIEDDFSRSLVRDFLSFIACGRQGMTGEELQELLSKHAPIVGSEGLAPKLPDMLFSRLRRAFSTYLFERSGVIDFFHGQLKEAVGKRYLKSEPDRIMMHHVIAEYFERRWREPYVRALDELPHQLIKAEAWEGLESVLCNLNFVEAKCSAGMTYDLVHDYEVSLDALPEAQPEVQERLRHKARIKKYTDDLIAYAKGEIDHLDIIPSFEPWSEEKIKQDTEKIVNYPSRLDRIRAFSQFVNSESNVLPKLASFSGFTAQQAYNSARNGPVADTAEQIVSADTSHLLLLHSPSHRIEYTPHPALLRTLQGHTGAVTSVSLTADGKRAVSASKDETLKVWDVESGKCLKTLQGHTGFSLTPYGKKFVPTKAVTSVSLTADGKRAISASEDETLRVWDVESGECLRTLQGHTGAVTSVSLTADGKRAISTSKDETLRVWDVESGECLKTLQGDTENCVCLTPDGKRAISDEIGYQLTVWDVESGERLKTLRGSKNQVMSISLTADGKRAVSASQRPTMMVWDVKSGECTKTLEQKRSVYCVSLTADGKRVVSGSDDRNLRVWDIESGECLRTLQGHTDRVECVSLTPDGKRAVSAGSDKTLRVWDIYSGESLKTPGHTGFVTSVSLTTDGKRAVSVGSDKTLRVWDIESGECLKTLQGHTGVIESVSLTVDGKRAISTSWDETLRVWDIESGECLRTLQGHTGAVTSVSLTPDGKRAISTSYDETLKVWNVDSGELIKTLQGHTSPVIRASLTLDGKRAVSASMDRTLKIWDVNNGELLRTLHHKTSVDRMSSGVRPDITCVCLTPDGKRVVTGSEDRMLRVWDVESGELLKTLRGHTNIVIGLRIMLDGKKVISASWDETLRVWDIESGECLRTLQGHTDRVECVSLTPDGKRAVSASKDETLKIWDIESGECLMTYHANSPMSSLSNIASIGHFALGTITGEVIPVVPRNLSIEPPLVTPVRLWLQKQERNWFGKEKVSVGWDDNITVVCRWCGKRFPVSEEKLNLIKSLNRNANLSPSPSSYMELPSEAWNEPKLLLECPFCHKWLKLNPFIADNSMKREKEATRHFADLSQHDDKFNAQQWIDKGDSMYNSGHSDEALKCYDKAIVINSQKAEAWNHKAEVLDSRHRFDEAIKCYEKGLEIDPQDALNWNNKGSILTKLDRFEEALKCYRKALEINSELAGAWFNKGNAEDKLGLTIEAVASYQKFIKLAPPEFSKQIGIANNKLKKLEKRNRKTLDKYIEDVSTRMRARQKAQECVNNGNSFFDSGCYNEAAKSYTKALEIDPQNADSWNNKGNSLNKLGRFVESIECYDKSLEINPESAKVWFNKGNSLDSLGRFDEAVKCYDKALEINPKYADAWINKGFVFHHYSRFVEAIECFDKALQIDPRNVVALNNKLVCLRSLGESRSNTESKRSQNEFKVREWFEKGYNLSRLGRLSEAVECYDKALEINPQNEIAWFNKGVMLGNLHRYPEALDCINKTLEINPQYENAWVNKAVFMFNLHRYPEALDCINKTLEINPQNALTWFNKGVAEDQLGLRMDAVISYRKFIELATEKEAKYIEMAHKRLQELAGS